VEFFNPLAGSDYEQAWGPWLGTHHRGQNWQSDAAWDLLHSSEPLPVFAPITGTVVSAGPGGSGRFAGAKVGIQGDEASVFLTHMRRIDVAKGTRVTAGTRVGTSGKANGVWHLHIGLGGPDYFDSSDDNGRDPSPFLRATADVVGTAPSGRPLYRGRDGMARTQEILPPPLPDGRSLRLVLNGVRFVDWEGCREPMVVIARDGLRPEDRAVIAWRKRTWRENRDVENVVRNLVTRFLS
jgi:hypothetical protein